VRNSKLKRKNSPDENESALGVPMILPRAVPESIDYLDDIQSSQLQSLRSLTENRSRKLAGFSRDDCGVASVGY
jgi:hypothetical protein